jgi:hypothetical protein
MAIETQQLKKRFLVFMDRKISKDADNWGDKA